VSYKAIFLLNSARRIRFQVPPGHDGQSVFAFAPAIRVLTALAPVLKSVLKCT
jgi:hypothetical protein